MRKPDVDLPALTDLLVRIFGPEDRWSCERTATGVSTQVYRLRRDAEAFYVRIAEDSAAAFAPEWEVHRRLLRAEVRVPAVVHLEPFDDRLERSVMVTTEIPGGPVDSGTDPSDVAAIYRAAGRDLARVHSVPVQGFGWLRRRHGTAGWPLIGEFESYPEFVDPSSVVAPLVGIGFTCGQADQVATLLEEVVALGPPGRVGLLAHGDFDTSHVFGGGGRYTGLIDFGEVRGTDYTFDFATLQLNIGRDAVLRDAVDSPEAVAYRHVERGYREVRSLGEDHERRVYLACVFSAAQRLSIWFNRDGPAAAEGWFFQWLRSRLADLLHSGKPPLQR